IEVEIDIQFLAWRWKRVSLINGGRRSAHVTAGRREGQGEQAKRLEKAQHRTPKPPSLHLNSMRSQGILWTFSHRCSKSILCRDRRHISRRPNLRSSCTETKTTVSLR